MSLATRCSSCGTIFRVVQDQLRVSEGWVRCGRCQQVFNAHENLFDLDTEAPPPWPPASAAPVAAAAGDWASTQHPDAAAAAVAEVEEAAGSARDPAGLSTQPLLHTPSREGPDDEAESSGFEDARFNVDLLDEETATALKPTAEMLRSAPPVTQDVPPEFLLRAERAARWQTPAVRAAVALVLVLGCVLLAGQAMVQFRSQLAAQSPAMRAWIEPLCGVIGCRIEPPRRIESLSVDSTALARLGAPGTYKLAVVLHNHASTAVMMPALELSVTDAQGQVVSRKVLLPSELGVHDESVAAGADLPLQAVLSTGEQRIVGYTVEIFYP